MILIACLIATTATLLVVPGCGGDGGKKDCLRTQRNFLTAADLCAADTGSYPTGPTSKWPNYYYEGGLKNNAPVCPGGGTITVTYGDSSTRPTTSCSKHGSP